MDDMKNLKRGIRTEASGALYPLDSNTSSLDTNNNNFPNIGGQFMCVSIIQTLVARN